MKVSKTLRIPESFGGKHTINHNFMPQAAFEYLFDIVLSGTV